MPATCSSRPSAEPFRPTPSNVARLRRGLALCGALLAGGLGACGPAGTPSAAQAPPTERVRVVLITLDTWRHDGFGEAMPELAARAQHGLLFERAYASSSSTQPSHASLFTGLPPWEHGVTRNGLVLGEQHETLAEQLSAAGFDTSAVVASFPLHPRFGLTQGFAHVRAEFDQGRREKTHTWEGVDADWDRFHSLCDTTTREALAAVDELSGDRQFLWVHYYDPHSPYGDSAGLEKTLETKDLTARAVSGYTANLDKITDRARRFYDQDLTALDTSLARLLERLDADGQAIATHVVITSDHGESFGDDGSYGHGARLTPAQVHVPLLLLSPRVQPGRRDDVTGLVDVYATLRELAGLPVGPRGRGRDLLAGAPRDGGRAWGMRRTYVEDAKDIRSDGSAEPITGYRFFLVDGSGHWVGDAQRVDRIDVQGAGEWSGTARGTEVRRAFAAMADAADALQSTEDLSDEARQGLEALGYTR